MTIGGVIDYIESYLEHEKPQTEKTRMASQTDFDNF